MREVANGTLYGMSGIAVLLELLSIIFKSGGDAGFMSFEARKSIFGSRTMESSSKRFLIKVCVPIP